MSFNDIVNSNYDSDDSNDSSNDDSNIDNFMVGGGNGDSNGSIIIDKKICNDNSSGFDNQINNTNNAKLEKKEKKAKKDKKEPKEKKGDKDAQSTTQPPKKPTSIQMKIPISTTIAAKTTVVQPENPDDKVNIVIKSCKNITSKQALLIIPITKFFSNRSMLNKIITILKGESISLRLIDWFVTNYCKKYNILYNLNDFKGDQPNKTQEQLQSFDNFIIIHNNYKGQLKAYSKRNFDPFCRRNRIRFYYEDNKYFITTVGQLNFFKWALENHIVDYIEKHLKDIDTDMNLRCETVKKPGTKLNMCGSTSATNMNLDDTGLPLPMQMPPHSTASHPTHSTNPSHPTHPTPQIPIITTKKKKVQDGIIVETQTQIKNLIKSKSGGSTRKKRKEISTAASKSLSIHNFPTTLIFD